MKEPKLTMREVLFCTYAKEVMLVAREYIEAGNPIEASAYLREEARNMDDKEVMRRIAWACRRLS